MVRVKKPIVKDKDNIFKAIEKAFDEQYELEKGFEIFMGEAIDNFMARDTTNISKMLLGNPPSSLRKRVETIFSREGFKQAIDDFKHPRLSRPEVVFNDGCNLVIAHYPTMVLYAPREGVEPFLQFIRKPNCDIEYPPTEEYTEKQDSVKGEVENIWRLQCLTELDIDVCAYVNRLSQTTTDSGFKSITQGSWRQTNNPYPLPRNFNSIFHYYVDTTYSEGSTQEPIHDVFIDRGMEVYPWTTETFRSFVSGYYLAFYANRQCAIVVGRAKEILRYLTDHAGAYTDVLGTHTTGFNIVAVYREDLQPGCPPPGQRRKPDKNPPPIKKRKPKKCECDVSCCSTDKDNAALLRLQRIEKFLGIPDMPAQLPNRLIYPNGKGNYAANTLPQILEFLIRQIDKSVGFLPQKIKIKDTNAAMEGDQGVELEIHSFADFATQILQLVIDTEGDQDVSNNMLVRCLYELGFIHQGLIQTGAMVDGIVEHMDFKHKWVEKRFPFAFNPYAQDSIMTKRGFGKPDEKAPVIPNEESTLEAMMPALLKECELKIKVLVNDEKTSLNDQIIDIKRDTAASVAAVTEVADGKRLEQLVAASQILLQLQGAIDRKNIRQALIAGKLQTVKRRS